MTGTYIVPGEVIPNRIRKCSVYGKKLVFQIEKFKYPITIIHMKKNQPLSGQVIGFLLN